MCGRFTRSATSRVAEAFGLAPSQTVAVVALKRDATLRGLALLRWGLVPSWSNVPARGTKRINSRSDSLDKLTLREAFRLKRCLIPADGFFEWPTIGGRKQATRMAATFWAMRYLPGFGFRSSAVRKWPKALSKA